jgi:hypothetical protein
MTNMKNTLIATATALGLGIGGMGMYELGKSDATREVRNSQTYLIGELA